MPHISQAQFAKVASLSRKRIKELVTEGLPVQKDGRVDPVVAMQWIADNLDPARRAAAKRGGNSGTLGTMAKMRTAKMGFEARLLQIELKKMEGNALDRTEVEAAVFGRARFERDSWHGWSARASVAIASELSVEPQAAHALLDRLVREHLTELAETPFSVQAKVQDPNQRELD